MKYYRWLLFKERGITGFIEFMDVGNDNGQRFLK